MPFVHTHLPAATPLPQQAAIVQGIHQALVSAIGMPEDELFNRVHPYTPEQFHFSRSFNGMQRSSNVIAVEITMRRGRSDAMKRALYAHIAANLEKAAGVRPDDVLIFLHENDYSDWSVGQGRFAMALVQQPGTA